MFVHGKAAHNLSKKPCSEANHNMGHCACCTHSSPARRHKSSLQRITGRPAWRPFECDGTHLNNLFVHLLSETHEIFPANVHVRFLWSAAQSTLPYRDAKSSAWCVALEIYSGQLSCSHSACHRRANIHLNMRLRVDFSMRSCIAIKAQVADAYKTSGVTIASKSFKRNLALKFLFVSSGLYVEKAAQAPAILCDSSAFVVSTAHNLHPK